MDMYTWHHRDLCLPTITYQHLHSLIDCAVHFVAASCPTTFSAATDTLSKLEGRFEGGWRVWLHLLVVHLAMFTFSLFTVDPLWNLIWYCVMIPLGALHASTGCSGSWKQHIKKKMIKPVETGRLNLWCSNLLQRFLSNWANPLIKWWGGCKLVCHLIAMLWAINLPVC